MTKRTSGLEQARAAKPKVKRVFERLGNVNGVGLTRKGGVYAVKVNLKSPLDDGVKYPKRVDGVHVVIHVPGKIHKQSAPRPKKIASATNRKTVAR